MVTGDKTDYKKTAGHHGGQSLPTINMKAHLLFVFSFAGLIGVCCGHGMLWDPPNRSSLWRFGYDTPVNYDDNQLYCGGFNGKMGNGKCGICGDAYEGERPRENENGGVYGLGIITRRYEAGGEVEVSVNLEAEHKGYFVFHICNMDGGIAESEECFRTLRYQDGSRKYYVHGSRFHNVTLQLPEDIRCEHCVLRWHYRTGNSWGLCDDGTEALGCGPQETFRNCADIAIQDSPRRSRQRYQQ